MNANQRKDFLERTYLNKKCKIVADFQGIGDAQIGNEGVIVQVNDDRANTTLQFKFANAGTYWFFPLELEFEQEVPIVHKEKTGLKLVKKAIEDVDEFGNAYILHLLPTEEEKYLYLSSSLRTLLDVKNGEFISFALDKDNKLYYICKELDKENGYEVIDGKIESNVIWRNIYNTFNNEITKIEAGKVKLHISHYEREQDECPDYTLFLINEPWVTPEGKKKPKAVVFEESDKTKTWYESSVDPLDNVVDPTDNCRKEQTVNIAGQISKEEWISSFIYEVPKYNKAGIEGAFKSLIKKEVPIKKTTSSRLGGLKTPIPKEDSLIDELIEKQENDEKAF